MQPNKVETLVWVLIYGGLLTLGLGLSVRRTDDGLGTGLAIVGGAVAAVGFVLIYVRSRMKGD
jgi:hypothetical protein